MYWTKPNETLKNKQTNGKRHSNCFVTVNNCVSGEVKRWLQMVKTKMIFSESEKVRVSETREIKEKEKGKIDKKEAKDMNKPWGISFC